MRHRKRHHVGLDTRSGVSGVLTQDPFYREKKNRPFQLLETLRWDPQAGYALLGAHLADSNNPRSFLISALTAASLGPGWRPRWKTSRAFRMKVRLLLSLSGDLRVDGTPLESDPLPACASVGLPVRRSIGRSSLFFTRQRTASFTGVSSIRHPTATMSCFGTRTTSSRNSRDLTCLPA